MLKWDYMEVAPESLLVGREGYVPAITRLRELGQNGWEHYWTNANGTMLLKRRVEEAPPAPPAAAPKVEVKKRSSSS